MGRILDFAEGLLSGRLAPAQHYPLTPLLCWEEVQDGVAFLSGFANVTVLRTAAGPLLVDTGGAPFIDLLREALRSFAGGPPHTVIYTHGHVDHVGGMPALAEEARRRGGPPARVVAHEAVPERFARYRLTAGYNTCINTRQFRMPIPWPAEFHEPDLLYRDRHELRIGDEVVELHHARGETDDHSFVYVPGRRLLCCGDLFIWATPNAGNPQKAERYPREWAQALRRMAALGAELLCPGHGPPIAGAARVRQALLDTAALLESLVEQTLALMNAGAPLAQVLETVKAPTELLERPYLQPLYDEPAFIVRNIWRRYGGWYDGNPAHLLPAPEARLAAELAGLCGGARRMMERAQELLEKDELALACHLVELAAQAAPADPEVRAARAAIYRRRGEAATSLMARGVFLSAAEEG